MHSFPSPRMRAGYKMSIHQEYQDDEYHTARLALRRANAVEATRFHNHRRPHAQRGNWREHGDLQPDQHRALTAAAVRRARAAGLDVGRIQRWQSRLDFSARFPRLPRAEPEF